jgi:hypothetical protein
MKDSRLVQGVVIGIAIIVGFLLHAYLTRNHYVSFPGDNSTQPGVIRLNKMGDTVEYYRHSTNAWETWR